MVIKTIKLVRHDDEERVMQLANLLGYQESEDVDYLQYVAKYYQNMVDTHITELFLQYNAQQIEINSINAKKQLKEDLKESIGQTEIYLE